MESMTNEEKWMLDIATESGEGEEFITYGNQVGYNWGEAFDEGLSPKEVVEEIRAL